VSDASGLPIPPTSEGTDEPRPASRPSRGGRPCKLTLPVALRLVAALAAHADRREAARATGIALSTFHAWLALGRTGRSPFAELAAAVAAVERHRGYPDPGDILDSLLAEARALEDFDPVPGTAAAEKQ